MLLALPAAAVLAGEAPAPAPVSPVPVPPRRAAELERMVRQDCGSCHGLTLRGGLGRPITPEALAGRDPAQLAAVVLDGVPGTAMPPWRPLIAETEARWIADYLLKGSRP